MTIYLPDRCLRGLSCNPLAQLESTDGKSFICVGENDGTDRSVEQDIYTHCWKNADVDERSHWDKRDIVSTVSVMAQALTVIENRVDG